MPTIVELRDALPLTSIGKVEKKAPRVPDLSTVARPAARARRPSGGEIRARADRRDFERFAVACGDEDPGDVAPPLLLTSIIEWGAGPPLSALREDGTGAAPRTGSRSTACG